MRDIPLGVQTTPSGNRCVATLHMRPAAKVTMSFTWERPPRRGPGWPGTGRVQHAHAVGTDPALVEAVARLSQEQLERLARGDPLLSLEDGDGRVVPAVDG
jgi:hypothetical protein